MLGQDGGRHDVFVRVEHRLRSDELHESLNKLGRKEHKVAADEARSISKDKIAHLWRSAGKGC